MYFFTSKEERELNRDNKNFDLVRLTTKLNDLSGSIIRLTNDIDEYKNDLRKYNENSEGIIPVLPYHIELPKLEEKLIAMKQYFKDNTRILNNKYSFFYRANISNAVDNWKDELTRYPHRSTGYEPGRGALPVGLKFFAWQNPVESSPSSPSPRPPSRFAPPGVVGGFKHRHLEPSTYKYYMKASKTYLKRKVKTFKKKRNYKKSKRINY